MRDKKKLGVIGGMGARAGVMLLRKIIDYSPAESDQEFLEILFHNNSLIPDRTKAIVYNEPSPLDHLLRSVDIFNDNQVDVIVMGCITAHYYYDQISRHTNAVVINPLHFIYESINKVNGQVKRVGLLATTGAIRTGLIHKVLEDYGIEVVTLDAEDQENLFMQAVYMKNGFKSAHISDDARSLLLKAMERLAGLKVDVIIGGCTEVSIEMDARSIAFPYVDMLDLLAKKTVDCCYNPGI